MESREVVDSSTEQPPDNKQTAFLPSLPPLSTSFPLSFQRYCCIFIFVLQLLNSLTLSNKCGCCYIVGAKHKQSSVVLIVKTGAGWSRIWGKDILANNGFAA